MKELDEKQLQNITGGNIMNETKYSTQHEEPCYTDCLAKETDHQAVKNIPLNILDKCHNKCLNGNNRNAF